MTDEGFLSVPTNISLVMNTDGAQVFHSSNVSVWPVYFTINELPPNLRYGIVFYVDRELTIIHLCADLSSSTLYWLVYGVLMFNHHSSST